MSRVAFQPMAKLMEHLDSMHTAGSDGATAAEIFLELYGRTSSALFIGNDLYREMYGYADERPTPQMFLASVLGLIELGLASGANSGQLTIHVTERGRELYDWTWSAMRSQRRALIKEASAVVGPGPLVV